MFHGCRSGVVTDCMRLSVLEEPDDDSEIICRIDALSEVIVDEAESTDSFYKVCTSAGAEGFCSKKFIAIKPQKENRHGEYIDVD